LRLAFMGSPPFAARALEALVRAGHEIACVYTQPPRPAGRGKTLRRTAVHELADALGLPVRTPVSLRRPAETEAFAALGLDAAVVAAYGLILPEAVLSGPRLGCFNIHGSLLPRWRGAAPVQRAIMAGDPVTGVQIMKMDAGLDTGPVLLSRSVPIGAGETAGALMERLAAIGAELVVEALDVLATGQARLVPQVEEGACYAHKIDPSEARIAWSRPAVEVSAHIRGLSPSPGAWFERISDGERVRVKVLNAEVAEGEGAPGVVLDDRLLVACGEGAVRLTELQRAGRGPMPAGAFQQGAKIRPGEMLE